MDASLFGQLLAMLEKFGPFTTPACIVLLGWLAVTLRQLSAKDAALLSLTREFMAVTARTNEVLSSIREAMPRRRG